MTALKQNVRTLLSEVEKFLVETLKGVKLSGSVKDEKDKILKKVRQLLEENSGSASSALDTSFASGGSHKTSGGGDSGSGSGTFNITSTEENAYNDNIPKIAASELKNKLQAGLLDKKKKGVLSTSWEQRFCVVSGNTFYIYKKQSDSKQIEAFCLNGYECNEAPGLEKDASKKEMCFELTKPGSTTYQLRASSKDGMLIWKEAIVKGIQMGADDDEPGETYEDIGADQDLGKNEDFGEMDDIYEPLDENLGTIPVSSAPQEPDELYDDATSVTDMERMKQEEKKKEEEKAVAAKKEEKSASAPPPLPPSNRRRDPPPLPPTSEPPPPPPPKADLPAIPKSVPPPIPDRQPRDPPSNPPPIPNNPPPLPNNPPPLPGRGPTMSTMRVPQLRKPFMDRDEDFENVYLGKWDCEADASQELSFKQGDLIHVLSRDFDAESWWVGELEGKVGLVPKDFLHPAYVLVA